MAIYVRTAADFANKLPERYAQRTFLLGLAISLDRNGVIGRFSPVARRIESSESLGARQDRLSILGRPTIRGRTDLAAHFLGSSVLTMTIGARQAETAGLLKELADARGGSGFSNADMTANLAGIEFAKAVLGNELSLQAIARSLHPTLYVPTVTPLDEGLKWADVVKKYGHPASPRFHSHLKSLRGRVLGLQGFRGLTNAKADSQVPSSGGVPHSGARAFEDPRERYRRK